MVTSSGSGGSFGPDEINHRSILQACRVTGPQLRGIGYLQVRGVGRLQVRGVAGHAADVREGAPVLRAWPVGVERPHVAPRGISLVAGEAVCRIPGVEGAPEPGPGGLGDARAGGPPSRPRLAPSHG